MLRRLVIVAALGAVVAGMPALARDPITPSDGPARYSFHPVQDGFLRLDNQTGAMSYCTPRAVGWACQAVPEDRAALEKEIGQLQDEVGALKKEIAELKAPAKDNNEVKLKLPTREEIDQARAVVEDAWRRLVDMLLTMQKDMMRKG